VTTPGSRPVPARPAPPAGSGPGAGVQLGLRAIIDSVTVSHNVYANICNSNQLAGGVCGGLIAEAVTRAWDRLRSGGKSDPGQAELRAASPTS
jgi:hypothetical protein